jgi:hypothetical protein
MLYFFLCLAYTNTFILSLGHAHRSIFFSLLHIYRHIVFSLAFPSLLYLEFYNPTIVIMLPSIFLKFKGKQTRESKRENDISIYVMKREKNISVCVCPRERMNVLVYAKQRKKEIEHGGSGSS